MSILDLFCFPSFVYPTNSSRWFIFRTEFFVMLSWLWCCSRIFRIIRKIRVIFVWCCLMFVVCTTKDSTNCLSYWSDFGKDLRVPLLLIELGLSYCYSAIFDKACTTREAIFSMLCWAVWWREWRVPFISLESVPFSFCVVVHLYLFLSLLVVVADDCVVIKVVDDCRVGDVLLELLFLWFLLCL